MPELSYRRYQFPATVIQHVIWLYLRFTLSYRDVEELLAERGLDVSYETVRRWVVEIRPANCAQAAAEPVSPERHVAPRRDGGPDRPEAHVSVASRRSRGRGPRHAGAASARYEGALRLMRKLLRKQGFAPKMLVTDKLGSYGAAFRKLGTDLPSCAGFTTEQSGREQSSSGPATRAQDAALQVCEIGTAVPHYPCRRPQYVQPPASPDFKTDPAEFQDGSGGAMARLGCSCMTSAFDFANLF